MMVFLRFFAIYVLVSATLSGCRSVSPKAEPKEPVEGVAAEPTSMTNEQDPDKKVAEVNGAVETKVIPVDQSDVTLLKMIEQGVEGAQSGRGIARCKYENGFVTCFVQGANGVESLLENATSQKIRSRMIEVRKDAVNEPRLLADIICESAGDTAPPYLSKNVKCRFERVRAVNENIFDGDVAFEIASLLRSDLILGTVLNDLSGVISCRVLQRNINAQCTVRRIIQGGISDDARALGRKDSVEVSEKMIETIKEIRKSQSLPPSTEWPGELAGSLIV